MRHHVTVSKIHFKKFKYTGFSFSKNSGLTIIELVVIITITGILLSIVLLAIRPVELLHRSRDQKRINDISVIERIITEYKVDTGSYPDTPSVLRNSTTLPSGNSSLSNSSGQGWIDSNMSTYNSKLPLDPLNTTTYRYYYIHNTDAFEINAKLEYNTEMMVSDGGNDPLFYEVGTNLNLISP